MNKHEKRGKNKFKKLLQENPHLNEADDLDEDDDRISKRIPQQSQKETHTLHIISNLLHEIQHKKYRDPRFSHVMIITIHMLQKWRLTSTVKCIFRKTRANRILVKQCIVYSVQCVVYRPNHTV